ncbi:MAG: DUF881 domain-containing protein [Nocardioidaceae bacterium]
MTSGAESSPAPAPAPPRRRLAWRLATPVAFVVTGALFVASAHNSEGSDLRPGRYTDLASLVGSESRQVSDLKHQVTDLQVEVDRLASGVQNQDVRRMRREAAALKPSAGFTPVTGSAYKITLSDAPADIINSSTQPIERMIVHQQDIQAVVNALWEGGATGITVQGQRIITTTGIKCEGNAVQLDGQLFGQPYVIVATGNLTDLAGAITTDPYVQSYIDDSETSDIDVGWSLEPIQSITLPAYAGLRDLHYAQVSD